MSSTDESTAPVSHSEAQGSIDSKTFFQYLPDSSAGRDVRIMPSRGRRVIDGGWQDGTPTDQPVLTCVLASGSHPELGDRGAGGREIVLLPWTDNADIRTRAGGRQSDLGWEGFGRFLDQYEAMLKMSDCPVPESHLSMVAVIAAREGVARQSGLDKFDCIRLWEERCPAVGDKMLTDSYFQMK